MTDDEEHRGLFQRTAGGFDFQRLLEQMIPTLIFAAIIVYANSLVIENKVYNLNAAQQRTEENLRNTQLRIEDKVNRTDEKVNLQNEKLVDLNAKVVAYLGQQTALNTAMDTRLTYIERALPNGSRR